MPDDAPSREDRTPPATEFTPPKPGEPPLHTAARTGDHEAIRRLVDEGAEIDEVFDIGLDPGAQGWPATALMVAAGSGDGASAETMRLLIELGADPTRLTLDHLSAASFACEGLGWGYRPGGDAARLRFALDVGAPFPSDPREANRLLCRVAESGDPARLRILLGLGLSASGYWDPEEAAERQKAIKRTTDKSEANTPDPFADLPEDVKEILADSRRELDEESFAALTSAPYSLDIPLHCGAESGNAEIVRVLIDAGADPHARDNSKQTAMHHATSVEVIDELLCAGLSIEAPDEHGWTPLVCALNDIEHGRAKIDALIARGADIHATHDHGYTILMSAAGCGTMSIENMRTLIAAGADPHAVSEHGFNLFHAAIDINGSDTVGEILACIKSLGVDIEHRNNTGLTPLAYAIERGNGVEVRALCELGADPNAVCPMLSFNEGTCGRADLPMLHAAAVIAGVNQDAKTHALLEAGADPVSRNDDGFTALELVISDLCA